MKVVIKANKISLAMVRRLEAAGIVVTLIISGAAGAQGLERGDLKAAVAESVEEMHVAASVTRKIDSLCAQYQRDEYNPAVPIDTYVDAMADVIAKAGLDLEPDYFCDL